MVDEWIYKQRVFRAMFDRWACRRFLAKIIEGDCFCPHIGDWLSHVVNEAGVLIAENLENVCKTDALTATTLSHHKRPRRLDEHMKAAALDTVKERGLAPTTQTWARAVGQKPQSLAYARDKALLAYKAACQRSFFN